MFKFLQERRNKKQTARRLYGEILAQARQPVFYKKHGVPDSITGRFEMVVLHGFLLWNRLMEEGKQGQDLSQAVFDVMFRDMNYALRNSGVGDLAVPHHIKRMMKGYKGRSFSYKEGLELSDQEPDRLILALRRNLFATIDKPQSKDLDYFSAYIREQANNLQGQSAKSLLKGMIDWGCYNGKDDEKSSPRMVA